MCAWMTRRSDDRKMGNTIPSKNASEEHKSNIDPGMPPVNSIESNVHHKQLVVATKYFAGHRQATY